MILYGMPHVILHSTRRRIYRVLKCTKTPRYAVCVLIHGEGYPCVGYCSCDHIVPYMLEDDP
jgi:hypothetical protein